MGDEDGLSTDEILAAFRSRRERQARDTGSGEDSAQRKAQDAPIGPAAKPADGPPAGPAAGPAAKPADGPPAGSAAGPAAKPGPSGDAPRSRAQDGPPSSPGWTDPDEPDGAAGPDPAGASKAQGEAPVDAGPEAPEGTSQASPDPEAQAHPLTPRGAEEAFEVTDRTGAALVPSSREVEPLSPLAPRLGLAARLLQDRNVAVRGNTGGRVVGWVLIALGLILFALDRRAEAVADTAYVLVQGGPRVGTVGLGLSGLGAILAVLFTFVPVRRRVRLRLPASQAEAWDRVQVDARRLRVLHVVALSLLGSGLVLAAAAYPLGQGDAMAAVGVVLALAGVLVLVAVSSKRATHRRLYVQTLLLSRLEDLGGGRVRAARDARVGPVLRALDHLLGALPESAVRRFLASKEAEDYLELMDELSGEEDA